MWVMQLHPQKQQWVYLEEPLPVKVLKNLASPSDKSILQIQSVTNLLHAIKSEIDFVDLNEEYEERWQEERNMNVAIGLNH